MLGSTMATLILTVLRSVGALDGGNLRVDHVLIFLLATHNTCNGTHQRKHQGGADERQRDDGPAITNERSQLEIEETIAGNEGGEHDHKSDTNSRNVI